MVNKDLLILWIIRGEDDLAVERILLEDLTPYLLCFVGNNQRNGVLLTKECLDLISSYVLHIHRYISLYDAFWWSKSVLRHNITSVDLPKGGLIEQFRVQGVHHVKLAFTHLLQ